MAANQYITKQLERTLRKRLEGELRVDKGSRALYTTDASNYRQIPLGVVIPRSVEDIIQTHKICSQYGIPILSRGAGTSVAGQSCNAALVIDFSRHINRILDVDPQKRLAHIEPGLVLDDLRERADEFGLTFGPDPATHSRCTLGGMIGNNSCGVHSVMAGTTVQNVHSLDVLCYDGLRMHVGATSEEELQHIIREGGRRSEIYHRLRDLRDKYGDLVRERFPKIPRRVSGYNLDWLLPENNFHLARALVGTEGTCVTILKASVELIQNPRQRILIALAYVDIYRACEDVSPIMEFKPIGFEGLDGHFIRNMKKKGFLSRQVQLLPEGNGWLLVEFGADSTEEVLSRARGLIEVLQKRPKAPVARLYQNIEQMKEIWSIRESAVGASTFVPGEDDNYPGWEDAAVPPEQLGPYLRDLCRLYEKYHYQGVLYGHFGEGCVHTRINFDLRSSEGLKRFRSFMYEAADLVVAYGGSLSGEHGDGQARAELLPKMFGDELVQAFREFKAIWDPYGKMNPGKVVDANLLDQNIRSLKIHDKYGQNLDFQYPQDDGNFSRAMLRCIGIAKCRNKRGGSMCPSYMATMEEKYSTRGRARLLYEMIQGDLIKDGWKSKAIKASLDLCLSCKACKSECPVGVDIATYKGEFLSHYYRKRLRPLHAYVFGLIHWWARVACQRPRLANFFTQKPFVSRAIKVLAGIAPERRIPPFALRTFQKEFNARVSSDDGKPQVMVWPDTFHNHFQPEVLHAAVEVLRAVGYNVLVPEGSLSTGRPLYDYGMLKTAKRVLRNLISTLKPKIDQDIALIVLEPSSASVLRDEMMSLFPTDEVARRLSERTFLLCEFLDQRASTFEFPKLRRETVIHGHCHHKAITGMNAQVRVLSRMGLNVELLDSGCCGMAGAFGFKKGNYALSMDIGEKGPFPAIRNLPYDTLIVCDGFGCREQIFQGTGRHALHVAQVIQLAFREGKKLNIRI